MVLPCLATVDVAETLVTEFCDKLAEASEDHVWKECLADYVDLRMNVEKLSLMSAAPISCCATFHVFYLLGDALQLWQFSDGDIGVPAIVSQSVQCLCATAFVMLLLISLLNITSHSSTMLSSIIEKHLVEARGTKSYLTSRMVELSLYARSQPVAWRLHLGCFSFTLSSFYPLILVLSMAANVLARYYMDTSVIHQHVTHQNATTLNASNVSNNSTLAGTFLMRVAATSF